MRYELKYAVHHLSFEAIVAYINLHPASFTTLFPDRQINNYYFDTPDFLCFHQNVEGHPRRKKMRLRWYGSSDRPTSKSVLEFKNKQGELGWKDTYEINAEIYNLPTLMSAISQEKHYQSELVPTLKNTYIRSYFISSDGRYRLTIDRDQTFAIPFTYHQSLVVDQLPVVIEIKFDQDDFENSTFITDNLTFRQTKNSKYANGIELLYFS